MWLKELKIAVIEKNIEKLTSLMESLPKLEDPKEIDEAIYLIKAATELVEGLRDDTKNSMIQMKKNIDFLDATNAPHTPKLDIKS
ncbi:hypothetical protein MNB_SM-4-479 [hydrothermal vent metagenome]|uniref:Uncharacterized protein n=1 Tax=hydrothermal vent metagenome TaxID=652676 RepID=A0A1W1BBQ0_9ZZZZ